jgi:hypothetical protein
MNHFHRNLHQQPENEVMKGKDPVAELAGPASNSDWKIRVVNSIDKKKKH